MHKNIADFLAKNRPKGARSKVWPYRDEVLELRVSGASLQQICDYLGEQGVRVSKQYISLFIKKMEKPIFGLLKPTQIQMSNENSEAKHEDKGEDTEEEKPIKMPYKKFDFSLNPS
jgi:hypothetical protein